MATLVYIFMVFFSSLSFYYAGSAAAQEIFKLLPHTFVDPGGLAELFEKV